MPRAIPIAEDTPTVANTPMRAKLIPRKVSPTVAADAVDHLPHRGQRVPHRVVGVLTEPHVVVIPADQEDRVIRSGTGDDRAEQDDGLIGDTQTAELGEAGDHATVR